MIERAAARLSRIAGMSLRAWFLTVALVCCWIPGGARAGNDDELLLGNQAAMVAGAVGATVDDASATWYNPAGLGQVDRDQFDVSATVYTLRSYSVPRLLSTPSGASDDGGITEFVVAPTQIAYVRRLAAGRSLGFGYFVPKSSSFVLRENLTDGDGDPPSQWQLAAAGAETTHIGAIALGIAISSKLRVGGSLIGSYTATTSSASLFGAVSPGGTTLAASAITSIATYSRLGLQIGLGVQWQLTPALAAAVTMRSPELQLYATQNNNYNISVTSLTDPSDPRFGAMASEDKSSLGVELLRAGRAGLSLSWSYVNGAVTVEADVQPGLRRPRVEIDRKAVFNARLGWLHRASDAVSFGLGVFSDRSPDRTGSDLLGLSGHFYGATAGVQLSNEHLLAPSERASSLTFTSVIALRYAYCSGDFNRIVGEPDMVAQNPFSVEQGEISIHELGLYVGGGVRF